MKKTLLIVLACFFMLTGCSTHEKEKPSSDPIQEPAEPQQPTQSKEITVQGVLSDMTSTRMTITLKDGTLLNIDRTKMTGTSDAVPFLGALLEVVYLTDKDTLIGKSYTLLTQEKTTDEKINDIIASMSLEDKVGQLFMVRCPKQGAIAALTQYQFGGYILFDDVISPYTTDQFIANNQAFQQASRLPLLIGIDEEGGIVNRLSWYTNYRGVPFKSPQELYAMGGFDLITSDTKEKDALLKRVGVNMNFAPVADVSTAATDFIYKRAFGKDAAQTSQYVAAVVAQMKQDQVASVLKHFPGYGSNADTHTGSSLDQRGLSSFETSDFLPFSAGIEAGAPVILVSHNVIASMDPDHPASLSPAVHDLLRQKLGFQGVIITDDLAMDAIRDAFGDEAAAVMAVEAGNDMLISSNYTAQYEAILQAVQQGELSMEKINASVHRILRMKTALGLLSLS